MVIVNVSNDNMYSNLKLLDFLENNAMNKIVGILIWWQSFRKLIFVPIYIYM